MNSSAYALIIGFGRGSIQELFFATITAFPFLDVPAFMLFDLTFGQVYYVRSSHRHTLRRALTLLAKTPAV